ncbi:MAG: formate dehydrogenase accessory sulfurtransferase FdhD [Bacteroidetes bacterium]|nr:formate dehydrogenase accessory sulfurtransferase FdhD [Bacteroidota bacterium]
MATRDYQGRKFEMEAIVGTVDSLTIEEPLQININGKPFTVTMRTPQDDVDLVRGLLHSEGIVTDVNFRLQIRPKKRRGNDIMTDVDLSIPEEKLGTGYSNCRSLLSVSSCGICGRTELEDLSPIGMMIDDDGKMEVPMLHEMFRKMNDKQTAFRRSGGTHAAAAFANQGKMLCSMEDTGRHNAVDKVIGSLIRSEKLHAAFCMIVSGRVSYEIVIKCFKAGIPFLAAISAPSSLAVDYAKELGITLFAFCREERVTCFSHPRRAIFSSQYAKVK